MCTVSVIALTHQAGKDRAAPCGFRLVTSRDELRTRPSASRPRWHDASACVVGPSDEAGVAIYPMDPTGGGTWIGVGRSGLTLCLLNANPTPAPVLPPASELISRGLIIPRLLGDHDVDGIDAAMSALADMPLDRFAPFRLVGVENDAGSPASVRVVEASWDRTRLSVDDVESGPACFVSSALGDALVKPRLALFDAMVRGAHPAPGQGQLLSQDRFHRHTWPGRPEISVLMSRPDARTVSITTVEVVAAPKVLALSHRSRPLVSMSYEPVIETAPVENESAVATT